MHESPSLTPYELVFGRLAITSSCDEPEIEGLSPSYDDHLRDLIKKLNELKAQAADRLVKSKERNKKW